MDSHGNEKYVELNADREELKGFSRSFAELEWLLLLLVLLYVAVPGTYVRDEFALVLTMGLFAAFVILFRYVNFYRESRRWNLVIETWVMIMFVGVVLWFTGRQESPLINIYLLVIIFSALTLGKLHTMVVVVAIAVVYLFIGYSVEGTSIVSLDTFSLLMAELAPFVLVAYLTTMLSSDIQMARREIKQLATTDELTDIFNMRAFRFVFDKELQRSIRYTKTFSLLMIDADGFKEMNDQLGHTGGDRLLKTLAGKFRAELRGADSLARYGGDEFIVLLPETDKATAAKAAERLRSSVAELEIKEAGKRFSPTVSIGVATYPDDGSTADGLLECADQALYECKRRNGNCVTARQT